MRKSISKALLFVGGIIAWLILIFGLLTLDGVLHAQEPDYDGWQEKWNRVEHDSTFFIQVVVRPDECVVTALGHDLLSVSFRCAADSVVVEGVRYWYIATQSLLVAPVDKEHINYKVIETQWVVNRDAGLARQRLRRRGEAWSTMSDWVDMICTCQEPGLFDPPERSSNFHPARSG